MEIVDGYINAFDRIVVSFIFARYPASQLVLSNLIESTDCVLSE
jgi:hypothetical protein